MMNRERNCPKHVEFYSKNKYEKLMHLLGFITRKYKMYGNTKFRLLHATNNAVLFQNRYSQHVETDK